MYIGLVVGVFTDGIEFLEDRFARMTGLASKVIEAL
jgi:hypothetical protein